MYVSVCLSVHTITCKLLHTSALCLVVMSTGEKSLRVRMSKSLVNVILLRVQGHSVRLRAIFVRFHTRWLHSLVFQNVLNRVKSS